MAAVTRIGLLAAAGILAGSALLPPAGAAPRRRRAAPARRGPTLASVARSLRAATTLRVKVEDALAKGTAEYWFRKPNRYRAHFVDGSRTYCDGVTLVTVDPQGKRTESAAPKRFPEEVRLPDFEPFFGGEGFGEWMGRDSVLLGGKRRSVYWLKTTESAIMYGRAFVDAKTLLPVGHHTTEYNDVVTDLYYSLVRLNEPMADDLFRAPTAASGEPAR